MELKRAHNTRWLLLFIESALAKEEEIQLECGYILSMHLIMHQMLQARNLQSMLYVIA